MAPSAALLTPIQSYDGQACTELSKSIVTIEPPCSRIAGSRPTASSFRENAHARRQELLPAERQGTLGYLRGHRSRAPASGGRAARRPEDGRAGGGPARLPLGLGHRAHRHAGGGAQPLPLQRRRTAAVPPGHAVVRGDGHARLPGRGDGPGPAGHGGGSAGGAPPAPRRGRPRGGGRGHEGGGVAAPPPPPRGPFREAPGGGRAPAPAAGRRPADLDRRVEAGGGPHERGARHRQPDVGVGAGGGRGDARQPAGGAPRRGGDVAGPPRRRPRRARQGAPRRRRGPAAPGGQAGHRANGRRPGALRGRGGAGTLTVRGAGRRLGVVAGSDTSGAAGFGVTAGNRTFSAGRRLSRRPSRPAPRGGWTSRSTSRRTGGPAAGRPAPLRAPGGTRSRPTPSTPPRPPPGPR